MGVIVKSQPQTLNKFISTKVFSCCSSFSWTILTHPAPCISESCIKIKIYLNFYFQTSFKAFIKPFDAPQRSAKIKILSS